MKTVAGVFRFHQMAVEAAAELKRAGFTEKQINLFYPGSPKEAIHSVPESTTEQPGMGGAIGGLVGGALGLAGGVHLGAAATALVPGVGPILAVGLAGAALFGAGGAALGKAAEDKTTHGVPSDEIFFYEDALRQGRSVVLLLANDDAEEERARTILERGGAESIDAARKNWWLGLRDVEEEHYRASGHTFGSDEERAYRAGFEAALRPECRGGSLEERAECLKRWHGDLWNTEPFKQGYARGREYWERRLSEVK